ncbi:hypothetical protein EVAR_22418_1 [Eumeta japonica]|uniref:Uncharacterized protein n=1 Tax=Eumeta variegata TaxID=151549 RepID=A0A4C1SHJ5_EUMVA|nr:hypothetical protein EVAR_22418_1 [Eumeta japonica]
MLKRYFEGCHDQDQRFYNDASDAIGKIRSPAPNGRYRAPAPSALTKLFAFVQIAARDPPALPIESRAASHHAQLIIIYYFRSNRWLPNGVNEAICSEPQALAFPLRGTANRTDLGPPALEVLLADTRCRPPTLHNPSLHPPYPLLGLQTSSDTELLEPLAEHPIVCSHTCPSSSENSAGRPASSIVRPTNNRRLIDTCATTGNCTIKRARLPWTKIPLLPWGGRVWPQTPITLEFIQQVLTKALSEMGYEAPRDVVKTNRESDPVSSRASSRATSPMKTNKK